ncbi:MAG: hypothetical protein AB7W47_02805 [Calditrichaceae bacterium]
MKSFIFTLLLLITCGYSQMFYPKKIVPKKLNFFICSKIIDGERYPIIHFSSDVTATNTSFWTSDLFISTYFKDDRFVIDVLGYSFMDNSDLFRDKDWVLSFVNQNAEQNVIIPYKILNQLDIKEISIKVGEKVNLIKYFQKGLIVYLEPKNLLNLEIDSTMVNHPLDVILFPENIYSLYVSGSLKDNYNYSMDLINFIKKSGILLADEKFPQIKSQYQNSIKIVLDNKEYKNFEHLIKNSVLPNHNNVKLSLKKMSNYCK